MADDRVATETESRLWGLAAFLVGLIVGIAVAQFERIALAEAAGYSTVAIIFTGWVWRRERKRGWFWWITAAITIVHVVAVATLPWPALHEPTKGDIRSASLTSF